MTKKVQPNDQELLELGKKLQAFYDSGYVNKKQALHFAFLKGLASGFGAFLGGTILIGLLVWTLSFFENIPFLSHFVNLFHNTLNGN